MSRTQLRSCTAGSQRALLALRPDMRAWRIFRLPGPPRSRNDEARRARERWDTVESLRQDVDGIFGHLDILLSTRAGPPCQSLSQTLICWLFASMSLFVMHDWLCHYLSCPSVVLCAGHLLFCQMITISLPPRHLV